MSEENDNPLVGVGIEIIRRPRPITKAKKLDAHNNSSSIYDNAKTV